MSHSAELNSNDHSAELTLGIVVALPEELATLTKQKLQRGQCLQLGDSWIAYSGAGMTNAERAARLLLEKGVQRLISWGCAAGLAPELKPGDLVLAQTVCSDQQQIATDHAWAAQLKQGLTQLTIEQGPLYSSADMICHSGQKQQLQQQSQAAALDMESLAVATVAQQASIPFNVVRAIADPAAMSLPQAVQVSLNAEGEVELSKLLGHLLTHPWEIPGLIRLGLHFQAAQKTLNSVAKLLRQRQVLPPDGR